MNTPSRIGRYEIDGVLAVGATSSVFVAHDPDLDTPVALKVLADHLVNRRDLAERFLAQARALRAIVDERVVAVHDIGTTDRGQPYFVMDLVGGGSLADRLRARGDAPARERIATAVAVGRELAAALSVLHTHGVVHGDLKPENVFVAPDPAAGAAGDGAVLPAGAHVVLGDLAGSVAAAAGAPGTPGYMAPEQVTGGNLDGRTDLYAATALVLRVATGVPPRPHEPPPLTGRLGRFESFARAGLAAEPAARPADARAWLNALEHTHGRRAPRVFVAVAVVIALLVAAFALTRATGGGTAREAVIATGDAVVAVRSDGTRARVVASARTLGFTPAAAAGSPDLLVVSDATGNRVVRIARGRVEPLAGTGAAGDTGDGGAATHAELNRPQGVARHAAVTFVADTANNRVRAVDASGVIRTVAGNGRSGTRGDGGAAGAAQVGEPFGVATSRTGDVYVVSARDNTVRAFRPDATIRAVAGTGRAGFTGDGGPATAADLREPRGVAVVDDGRVFVADTGNERLRVIERDGRIRTVATFPGNPPVAVAAYATDVLVGRADGSLVRVGRGGRVTAISR